jgi:TetR/AcrR family transcriptional regulator, transcriptional repressor for nem operon
LRSLFNGANLAAAGLANADRRFMRYKPGHHAESHQRILQAVGRGLRTAGYSGVGVDGLAKAAGVTSGAFYGHFKSKAEAFQAAVRAGLEELRIGITDLQEQAGPGWFEAFADFYLSEKVTCPPGDACALPSFAPEVARADQASREIYQAGLLQLIEVVAAGLVGGQTDRRAMAWELLAKLVGAVMLARAVPDPQVAAEITSAVRRRIGNNTRSAGSGLGPRQSRTRAAGDQPAGFEPRKQAKKRGLKP